MNRKHEELLEAALDGELKKLPLVAAPASLVSRVMAEIEKPALARSTGSSWSTWSLRWRGLSFAGLAVLSCGLCFGLWLLLQTPAAALIVEQSGHALATFRALWNAVPVIAGAAAVATKQLGPVFIAAALMLVGIAYLTCIGVGTMVVRFAVSRR
jgi:hypothetical protein